MVRLFLVAAILHFGIPAVSALAKAEQPEARWSEAIAEGEEEPLRKSLTRSVYADEWLKAAQIADTYRGRPSSVFSQWQAFVYAMVGRVDLVSAMQEEGRIRSIPPCNEHAEISHRDALETIVQEASDHRIIILQERHTEVRHRLLLHELLPALEAQGFDFFAAEDFGPKPETYKNLTYVGGAPALHSSREPVFADAVRRAIELKYRLVPYEATWPPPKETAPEDVEQWRADQQVEHLRERIFAVDPDARVIIFAGEGHARERAEAAYVPMALRLKQRTGIDPLTVDQTACRLINEPSAASGAAIAFEPDGSPSLHGFPNDTFDLQVRHGPERFAAGRAEWLARLNRKPVNVPAELRRAQEPLVIEAYLAREPADAAAFDRIYLGRGETLPLMLSPGAYRVIAHRRDGSTELISLKVK